MKLLIKIFFQTTCIILLASSGIFLYTTYCWKNQSIQNINSYESSIFRTNILQFENKTSLSDNQKQNADNEMRPQIVTYAFRQVFHDRISKFFIFFQCTGYRCTRYVETGKK